MPAKSLPFDRAAGFYDETRGFPPGVAPRAAALLAKIGGLDAASRVLEIGIGTGRVALPLAALVRGVWGVDLSRPMMQRLRAKQSGEPVYPLEGDAARLPFPAAAFDAAVAVHVFHVIGDWQEALRELARVLRPGAPLIHAWSHRGDVFRPIWEAWQAVVPPAQRLRPGVSDGQRDTFLTDEGWRLIADDSYAYTVTYSPQNLIEDLQNRSTSSTWHLTDDELTAAIAAARAAIAERFDDPTRPLVISAWFRAQAYLPPEGISRAPARRSGHLREDDRG